MNALLNGNEVAPAIHFTPAQKEYLAGFMAGATQRGFTPFVGHTAGGQFTGDPALAAPGGENLAAPPTPEAAAEETLFGTPISELCKQELWKLERHGLDIWERLIAHAESDKLPDEQDTFYFRFHGLFYVGPVQESLMLRCRIPAGELSAAQLDGLADLAEKWGGGYGDLTTRANVQVREIAPKNLLKVLLHLQEIGLSSKGTGVDNIRNITATPTAGLDREELFDCRPLAKALQHYILNTRDMFGLPRKFNVAFDGGGAISAAADTNDIGFFAVRVGEKEAARGAGVAPGVYFRVQLAGITGHQQFAKDAGVLVRPEDCVAVAAAIIRVFNETGDRTNRKRARLKYVIDRLGIDPFMALVEKKLAQPFLRLPESACEPRPRTIPHGHIGVFRQRQPGLNYVGAVVPVGRMSVKQMRRFAELARNYGSGEVRLTVFQNLIIPNVPDAFVETVKRAFLKMGFHHEASAISGGLVACTGNAGCKWAASNTKRHAVELARYLEKKFTLDQPINIHLTGCPNSCAQHYMGDIGLLGTKVGRDKEEGYHVFVGGGFGEQQAVAREVFRGVSFPMLKETLEKMLRGYLRHRREKEDFSTFTRRCDLNSLQAIFSNEE
ncbi:MAG: NirA family protein [Verrucomicrobia bacterium]|nr:NirA family protein [Verrucomicrobiota bacterium]